jgi:hypothetical protein
MRKQKIQISHRGINVDHGINADHGIRSTLKTT